jgi:tRNA (cmo5U34)-methyltransferase
MVRMSDKIWRSPELGKLYLEGVRGGIPLAAEQLEVLAAALRRLGPAVSSFLDLGCGDGVLGRFVHSLHPGAEGTFLDFSEYMIEAARAKTVPGAPSRFVLRDYGERGWEAALGRSSFDAVVSGYSIHHQPDARKRELYREVFDLLVPGGIFLNLEHVASPTRRVEEAYEEFFVDALHDYQTASGKACSREDVRKEYMDRPDDSANILAPVDEQCAWLREVGFVDVDCFFKVFELALFGGVKPRP